MLKRKYLLRILWAWLHNKYEAFVASHTCTAEERESAIVNRQYERSFLIFTLLKYSIAVQVCDARDAKFMHFSPGSKNKNKKGRRLRQPSNGV
jgi:hypothetical protein